MFAEKFYDQLDGVAMRSSLALDSALAYLFIGY